MKLLSAVFLSALSLVAVPALAVEASPSPLLGRWSLDIATSALPEAQRPKQVVLEFRMPGWTLEFARRHRAARRQDHEVRWHAVPRRYAGALVRHLRADKANLKLPAPNTLVMQLVDHDTPASTRIYTVADRTTMTETKAFYGHDGTPILQTNLFKRIP